MGLFGRKIAVIATRSDTSGGSLVTGKGSMRDFQPTLATKDVPCIHGERRTGTGTEILVPYVYSFCVYRVPYVRKDEDGVYVTID